MRSRLITRAKPSVFRVPRAQSYAPFTTTQATSPFRRKEDATLPSIQDRTQDRVFKDLPLSDLARTLSVLSVAALPTPLLSAIIGFVRRHSGLIVSSRILSWPIKKTFYKVFCVGETRSEIAANIATLRSRGINGVALSFAREAKLDGSAANSNSGAEDKALSSWVASNIETISQVSSNDYIAVKFTGAGAASVKAMQDFNFTDSTKFDGLKALKDGMFEICDFAKQRGVKVMVDAESSLHQPAIDYLTLEAMAAFNTQGSALVFNTYQMYLKASLDNLKSHLQIASTKGYTMGIKLVRGAYIYVEPNRAGIIHDTKPATDTAYDDAVDMLIRGTPVSSTPDAKPWSAEVMLATHNTQSVDKAMSLYRQRNHIGQPVQKLVFAQLMGMADEISMKLAREIKAAKAEGKSASGSDVSVYKYSVWGSLEDCLLYMLRRAEENQDAATRSRVTAGLMLKEIGNRIAFWR
ncbi:FAD-linked oxidoreductase [Bimuria novae-zelandiae CBS 107.79]|uniref:Proline dehydrogenase n=1 Tax=Bimuria novae-zelandiae CBS 107.79 TaxID=1447943 RepID=A0A6A5UWV9_9PLEO|nr:FAD-linked oxidoreductase [Bimuria novae-zelandiae CBS 107.79]